MAYEIQKADLSLDEDSIVGFWKRNFPAWPVTKYQWFYRDNIYGPADCWLIRETASDEVVGSTAVFPRRVHCQGSTLMAGIAGDFGVDRRHRILGPALQLQKMVAESASSRKYDILYGTPNRSSEPVTKRVGFQVVGGSDRRVRLLRTQKYLPRLLRAPALAGIAGATIDLGLKLFARESRFNLGTDLRSEILERPDERFDRLWEVARNSFGLIGERDRAFLTWRFADCPHQQYRFFAICRSSNGALIGYVVYSLEDDVISIADLLAETPQGLQDIILPAFMQFVRRIRCDSVSIFFFGCSQMISILGRSHFVRREGKRNIIALTHAEAKLKRTVLDPQNWYFLGADNDV